MNSTNQTEVSFLNNEPNAIYRSHSRPSEKSWGKRMYTNSIKPNHIPSGTLQYIVNTKSFSEYFGHYHMLIIVDLGLTCNDNDTIFSQIKEYLYINSPLEYFRVDELHFYGTHDILVASTNYKNISFVRVFIVCHNSIACNIVDYIKSLIILNITGGILIREITELAIIPTSTLEQSEMAASISYATGMPEINVEAVKPNAVLIKGVVVRTSHPKINLLQE